MNRRSFAITFGMFLVTLVTVVAISARGKPSVVKTNLENLPKDIDGYVSTNDRLPDSLVQELNADIYLYRHYRRKDGGAVDLYLGYYGTAKGGRTGHNPYSCLPSHGWGMVEARRLTIHPRSYPGPVEVNFVLARKGQTYGTLFHWYQSAGNRVFSTGIKQNIHRFIGRIVENRDDGAFVQVVSFCNREGIEKGKSSAQSFAENLLELIPKYWPVEN